MVLTSSLMFKYTITYASMISDFFQITIISLFMHNYALEHVMYQMAKEVTQLVHCGIELSLLDYIPLVGMHCCSSWCKSCRLLSSWYIFSCSCIFSCLMSLQIQVFVPHRNVCGWMCDSKTSNLGPSAL